MKLGYPPRSAWITSHSTLTTLGATSDPSVIEVTTGPTGLSTAIWPSPSTIACLV